MKAITAAPKMQTRAISKIRRGLIDPHYPLMGLAAVRASLEAANFVADLRHLTVPSRKPESRNGFPMVTKNCSKPYNYSGVLSVGALMAPNNRS